MTNEGQFVLIMKEFAMNYIKYSRNVRPQVETLVRAQILSRSDLLVLRET